jgi:uncharacterized protein DUF6188
MSEPYERADGVWVLPLEGAAIERINADGELVLESGTTLSIGSPHSPRPIAELVGRNIRTATCSPTGTLTLKLDDDTLIEGRTLPDVEAWEIRVPGAWTMIALPGDSGPDWWP